MSETEQTNGGTESKPQEVVNEEGTPLNGLNLQQDASKDNCTNSVPTQNGTKETDAMPKDGADADNSASVTNGDSPLGNGNTEKGGKRPAEENVEKEETDKEPEQKKQKLEEGVVKVNGTEKKEESEDKKEEEKENKEVRNDKEKEFKLHKDASTVQKKAAEKCVECDYKCWTDAEMRVHCMTSHGSAPRRKRMCANCNFTCINTWEMDYHARSRGHKAKEVITCKKCDHLSETKEESWTHKKVHIPADKLFECGECCWNGDRLDNIRYHAHSQDHKMKIDYEAMAKAKAAEKGPKDLKNYETKLAKDIKKAKKGKSK